MRLLQAEIRRKLYQNKKDEPQNDSHPWFKEMEQKLEDWKTSSPSNDGGSGLDISW
jgi:hypothetical protein